MQQKALTLDRLAPAGGGQPAACLRLQAEMNLTRDLSLVPGQFGMIRPPEVLFARWHSLELRRSHLLHLKATRCPARITCLRIKYELIARIPIHRRGEFAILPCTSKDPKEIQRVLQESFLPRLHTKKSDEIR